MQAITSFPRTASFRDSAPPSEWFEERGEWGKWRSAPLIITSDTVFVSLVECTFGPEITIFITLGGDDGVVAIRPRYVQRIYFEDEDGNEVENEEGWEEFSITCEGCLRDIRLPSRGAYPLYRVVPFVDSASSRHGYRAVART